jgi:hypothetical protein
MPVATPNPALGVNARMALGATSTVDKPFDFESETLGLRESFLDPQGLRGTRSHAASRVRPNSRLVTGDVVLAAPTAQELITWLPYITGGTPAASGGGFNYPLAETLSAFYLQMIRGGSSRWTYSGCRVARATFSARKGTPLQLTLSLLGVDETKDGSAFPSLTLPTDSYFAFEDLVFTLAGTTVDIFSWQVVIDNFLQARMVNSQTATVVYTTDRVVSGRFEIPFGDDESTFYGMAQGGVAVSSVFTNGTTSVSFTGSKFQAPRASPDVAGRDETRLAVDGVFRNSGTANDEITVFADAT